MDFNLIALIDSFLIDLLIFGLLCLAFLFYRKIRSPSLEMNQSISALKPHMYEHDFSASQIISKVKGMSLSEIESSLGEWGFIYLLFHKYLLFTIILMCLFGIFCLSIVYFFGKNQVETEFHEFSIWHIQGENNLLSIPLIFTFLFSLLLYSLALFHYQKVMKSNTEKIILPVYQYVFVIKNLPRFHSPEFINENIRKIFDEKYKNSITSVYTVPKYEEAYKKYKKYLEYIEKIKFYQYEKEKTGENTQIKNKKKENIDAILHFNLKAERKLKSLQRMKEESAGKNAGIAFVTCDSRNTVYEILDSKSPIFFENVELKIRKAASPNDYNWENIEKTTTKSFLFRWGANTLFFFMFLIILTPATFQTVINDFFNEIGLRVIGDFIANYFPTLYLLVIQQFILPYVIEYLVYLEGHTKKYKKIASGFKKYIFFLVFYLFLYPLLGQQFMGAVDMLINQTNDWKNIFGMKISESGEFFTVFLIQEAFLKNGFDLLVIGKYLASKIKSVFASTKAEKVLAYQCDPFMFDMELAISINILIITTSFCIVYPLILIPSVLFFAIRYFIHKHNALAVFYIDKESSGFPILFHIIAGVIFSAFALQIATCVTLILIDAEDLNAISKIFIIFSVCCLIMGIIWSKFFVQKGREKNLELDGDYRRKIDEELYYHPIDKDKSIKRFIRDSF